MRLFLCLLIFSWPLAAAAQVWRVALWGHQFGGEGPGLLLRDIERETPELMQARQAIAQIAPDVLVLTAFDHDFEGRAVQAFAQALGFAHAMSLPTLAGRASGGDRDGDGRLNEAEDALAYGRFWGAGAVALFAQHPFEVEPLLVSGHGVWRVSFAAAPSMIVTSAQMPMRSYEVTANAAEVEAARLAYVQGQALFVGRTQLDAQSGRGARQVMATFLRQADEVSTHPTQYWGATALEIDYIFAPFGQENDSKTQRRWPFAEEARRSALLWRDFALESSEIP